MARRSSDRLVSSRRAGWWKRLAAAALGLGCGVTAAWHADAGTLLPLYSFTGGQDGGDPNGGVISDHAGILYGETVIGGALNCALNRNSGCGTIYSFNPATNQFKVLVDFVGANGAFGINSLTLSGSTLYGTTGGGGLKNDGVVFSVHTDGTGFTLLHQFSGSDGLTPSGNLQIGAGNVVYGLTQFGGANNDGVLYSIQPNGTYLVVHSFTGKTDGAEPSSLLISTSGTLVGSTQLGGTFNRICTSGCGNVFEYVPSAKKFSVVYLFSGFSGNGGEIGSIGPGPTVYGNDGTAPYLLNSASGLVNIGCFSCVEAGGGFPSGPLLAPDGTLIGVNGTYGFIDGSLYTASPSTGVLTILTTFGGPAGISPAAQPILRSSGNIIGTTTEEGLCSNCGTIWQYTP